MSLRDAVLEITDQMEGDVLELCGEGKPASVVVGVIRGYIRQLRSAVKASEGETTQPEMTWIPGQSNPLREALQQQAREELSNAVARTRAEESVGNQGVIITVLHGGPFDGDTVPISPEMPVGAKTGINGAVYKLTEKNELHYSEDDTAEYQKVVAGRMKT